MNLFNKMSGDSAPNKVTNENAVSWNDLTELKQLDDIVSASYQQPVFIFKHSTRCGVSRMVLKHFENHYGISEEIKAYFLDLLAHRDISNEIAHRFNVVHQSPQLILIKDGECHYTASHSDIDADELKEKIRQ